jgi:hypothetical protein
MNDGSAELYAKDEGDGQWTVTGYIGLRFRGVSGAEIGRSTTCEMAYEDGDWRLTAPIVIDY